MKIVAGILLVLAAVLAGGYMYLGGFSKVEVSIKQAGPYHLLYLNHQGPYNKVGDMFQKVQEILDSDSIKSTAGVGIYFDNPAHVEAAKLRSGIGVIVDDENLKAAAALVKEGKLLTRDIKAQDFVFAQFPFKNMLSFMVSVGKVYPELNRYAKDHNFPDMKYLETGYENNFVMEIYHSDKIEYLMTLP